MKNYTWRFLDMWFWVKSHWCLTKWGPLQSCGSLHKVESISGIIVSPRGREGLFYGGKSLKQWDNWLISKRSFWIMQVFFFLIFWIAELTIQDNLLCLNTKYFNSFQQFSFSNPVCRKNFFCNLMYCVLHVVNSGNNLLINIHQNSEVHVQLKIQK